MSIAFVVRIMIPWTITMRSLSVQPSFIFPMASDNFYQQFFVGVAASLRDGSHIDIGFCSHDGTYSTDFTVLTLTVEDGKDVASTLAEHIVLRIRQYAEERNYKFVGAGITQATLKLSPCLSARMWADLDVVPLVFAAKIDAPLKLQQELAVDEQADSMARECVMVRIADHPPARTTVLT